MKEDVTKKQLTFDTAEYAQSVKESETAYLQNTVSAVKIAGAATALSLFIYLFPGLIGNLPVFPGILLFIAIPILSVFSYIKCGGIVTILKLWLNVISWAWRLIIFPLDIMAVAFVVVFGAIAIICLPLVFVYICRREHKKNLEAAEEYLKFCH